MLVLCRLKVALAARNDTISSLLANGVVVAFDSAPLNAVVEKRPANRVASDFANRATRWAAVSPGRTWGWVGPLGPMGCIRASQSLSTRRADSLNLAGDCFASRCSVSFTSGR